MPKHHQWITEKEAAEKLKRHYRTVRSKVVHGDIPVSFRTVNGREMRD